MIGRATCWGSRAVGVVMWRSSIVHANRTRRRPSRSRAERPVDAAAWPSSLVIGHRLDAHVASLDGVVGEARGGPRGVSRLNEEGGRAARSALARSVLADRVKDRLLQDIFAGRYPADSRIVEPRVARELGRPASFSTPTSSARCS